MSNINTPVMAGWELQWIDPFDGIGVDWDNWTAQTKANYNNEDQCYTEDDSSQNKNYDVSGGTLTIIARRQSIDCPGLSETRGWSSGRLNSKDKREFQYGRLESRIRVLDTEGGSWPAFWMLENRIAEQPIASDNDFINWPNPGAGEIDVWEWFSNDADRYITNFYNNSSGCISGNDVRYPYPNRVLDVMDWHDYAIEWDDDAARFYIDDVLVRTQNLSACGQYEEPLFVLLNVAIGGSLGGFVDPTLNQARMEVDYVAHCNPTNTNTATRCNENTPGIEIDDLVIFDDSERTDWIAWDASGVTTPVLATDGDVAYAEVMEFSINGSTLVGFTTRAPNALNGIPYDASTIVTTGTLEFDLKMTAPPIAGATDWKLKVESAGGALQFVEVSLMMSIEGHAAPVQDQWQHYSFNLSDLDTQTLDLSAIDAVLVFPEYGAGNGAVFRIDNLKILGNAPQDAPVITSNAITSVVSGNRYSYVLTANDTEGDILTLSAPVLPDWLSFNSVNGLLLGTPNTSDVGSHDVTLMVNDGTDNVTQIFTVTVSAVQTTENSENDSVGGGGSIGMYFVLLLGSLTVRRHLRKL